MKTQTINGVKVGKHGFRIRGKYFPAFYSRATLIDGRDCITVYARGHGTGLPVELGDVQNDSDSQTDYFEKDRTRFFPGSLGFNVLAPLAK